MNHQTIWWFSIYSNTAHLASQIYCFSQVFMYTEAIDLGYVMSLLSKIFALFALLFEYLSRIFIKSFGIALILFSILLIVAISYYSPADQSFNTSSYIAPENVLSIFGSYSADILVQIFGYVGAGSLILMLFKHGYELAVRVKKKLKLLANDLLLVCLTCLFCQCAFNGYGGILGKISYSVLPKVYDDFYPYISGVLLFVSLCISFDELFKIICENFYEIFCKIRDNFSENSEYNDVLQDESKQIVEEKSKPSVKVKAANKAKKKFELPSTILLKKGEIFKESISKDVLTEQSKNLITVLNDFGIEGEMTSVNPGPVVTLFELKPAAGIKSSRVIGLASDIARYMSAISARVAVIPGKNALGIELPNKTRQTVYLRPLLESKNYLSSTNSLPIVLGRNIGGVPVIADLAKMPHLLIAGTTGSGKSVGVNAMILSILYRLTPDQCRFIMVDPKMLELSIYNDIPHLLTPVVTDPKKAVVALKWAVKEMENRYTSMSKIGVRNIDGYNEKVKAMKASGEIMSRKVQTGFDTETGLPIYEEQLLDLELIPYIVIVVDEMADLMLVAGKDIESAVQRLAQMARAAGIHLIMATQRPSVDVITGTIKANFPTRISFQVSSKIDSRTILGEQGAEQLLGQGDMLYMPSGGRTVRVHGPFVSDSEVESVVNALKAQGAPKYVEEILLDSDDACFSGCSDDGDGDPLYNEAIKIIKAENKVSTSFLQRKLQIGYNRAARIVDLMEQRGVVSQANHVGKREILQ